VNSTRQPQHPRRQCISDAEKGAALPARQQVIGEYRKGVRTEWHLVKDAVFMGVSVTDFYPVIKSADLSSEAFCPIAACSLIAALAS